MNKIINKKISNTEKKELVDKKIKFFQEVIQKTILYIQKNKLLDILGISEVNQCIQIFHEVNQKITCLIEKQHINSEDQTIDQLQSINNQLSTVLKMYGTDSLEDLLSICFGSSMSLLVNSDQEYKYGLLKKYFHPTGYKILNQQKSQDSTKNKKMVHMDDTIIDNVKNLDCFDIFSTEKTFHMKVHGMKIYLYHPNQKLALFIYGIVDDIVLKFLSNSYIISTDQLLSRYLPNDILNNKTTLQTFNEYIQSLTLKDYL